MKKYLVGSLSALMLVVLVATPASAATEMSKKKPSKASVTQCEKRVKILNNISGDLSFFKETHYILPADLSQFKTNKAGVVEAKYVSPPAPAARKGKVNYALVHQRFENTHSLFDRTVLIADGKKALNQANLTALYAANVEVKNAMDAQKGAVEAAKKLYPTPVANGECATAAGQKKVANLMKERAKKIRELKKGVSKVSKSTQVSRKYYKKLNAERNKLKGKINPAI